MIELEDFAPKSEKKLLKMLIDLEIDDDSIVAILSNLSTDDQRTIVMNHISNGQETTSEELTVLALCIDSGLIRK